jgi:LmbE family N-acetylglucosaminyl deacetylase
LRWIYFSPHLDDAILSCGGLIRQQSSSKLPIEIWTICAGDPPESGLSPFSQHLHKVWASTSDTPAIRRVEDSTACRHLGARFRHLSIPDCIYRQDGDGNWLYPSEESLFGDLKKDDLPTIQTINTFLVASLKVDDILVSPLAVGNHVDHQLTRKAVEEVGRNLFYYADVPYLFREPAQFLELTRNLLPEIHHFPQQALVAWQESVEMYRSQLQGLFESVEAMREAICIYYQNVNGLKLWKPV